MAAGLTGRARHPAAGRDRRPGGRPCPGPGRPTSPGPSGTPGSDARPAAGRSGAAGPASAIRSFASGELRAKTTSAPDASRSSSWASVIASSSVLLTTRMPSAPMPTLRAIAAAVSPLSPVTTWTRMPAWCSRSIAAGISGRGGSSMAPSPARHRSRSASSRRSGTPVPRGQRSGRHGEHAQPGPGVAGHDPRDLVAVRRGERHVLAAAVNGSAAGPPAASRPGRRRG
jgi:hypothetical protein